MPRNSLAFILLVFTAALAVALGNPEKGEYRPVQGLENWDASLDLEGLKQGKYNLIVRARDEAGNIGYEGPYNVFVDPRSDLPVARISHPAAGSRAASQLEVIGTCVDDDGVQSVRVSLDGGEPATAKGTDFWSLPLDIASLEDGEHTLSALGVDLNGLEGPVAAVRFHVDKRAPLIRVTNHSSGALVSGQVELKGEVEDPNGLASLAWSREATGGFLPLKMALDKPGRSAEFQLPLDTRELPDGPLVLWLQAGDRTGSTGRQAFLLFVNNEAPVLEILSPAADADTAVHGKVRVVGRAADKLGLRGLQFEAGEGLAGSVPLTPGNPFWAQELDLSARKAGALQVDLTLENLAGIRQTARLRLKLDPEADRPRLTLLSPQAGARLEAAVLVAGLVQDEDPEVKVEYSLDGGAPSAAPAAPAFGFPLEGLAGGEHRLTLKAVDAGGVSGAPVTVAFTVLGPLPRVSLGSLTAVSTSPFLPGAVFAGDKDGRLSGTIRYSGPGLKAEYSLAGAAPRPLALKKGAVAGEQGFDILLPKALPAGRVDVVVRATDAYGRKGEQRSFLFRGAEQGAAGLLLADARLAGEAPVRLEPDAPLLGYLAGGPIQSVTVEPPTGVVRVSAEGALLRVEAGEPGVSGPVRLQVTAADGSRHSSEPLRFASDLQAPSLELARPANGEWLAAELRLEGQAADEGGLAAIEYSLDGGEFQAVAAAGPSGGFAATASLGALADGPHLVAVRAVDRAGNAVIRQAVFHKDAAAPTLRLLAPRAQDPVNGMTSLIGLAEDSGRIARVEVSEDGKSFRQIGQETRFQVELNLSLVPADKLLLRCTDAAGNVGQLKPELALNLEADKPSVQVQLPAAGELLRDDFVLSGMVFDDDQVAAIRYRLDGGEFRELEAGNAFRVPVRLAEVGDNEHTVEVQAEDAGGLKSEIARTTFMASTSDPVSALASPGIAEQVRGVVELAGASKDPNGIAEVRLSFDNGLSYYLAAGTESWRYRLDTRLLADGTHAVLVQATDSTGAVGLYTTTINVDNRPPELVLDTPRDGEVFTDSLPLDGRSLDNIAVASLAVSISPVAAAQGPGRGALEVPLSASGILVQQLDLQGLPAGWYNLRLEAADRAGNRSYVSRNFRRQAPAEAQRVELYYPADGETLAGPLSICGRVVAQSLPENVSVSLDGQPLQTAPLGPEGWFRLDLEAAALSEGGHTLAVQAVLAQEVRLDSGPRTVLYLSRGPWVRIASLAPGDYVTGRPFLEGQAGWFEPEAEPAEGSKEEARAAARRREEHKVRLVELSLDNGRSFHKADGGERWRYRLETQELPAGELRLLARATFANEEVAVSRTQLVVDTRAPEVRLLEPSEGGRFNASLQLLGTAEDEAGLAEVAVSLREGDKSRYQVPSFIQGLYLDAHLLGATYWDAGLGLTFFDDNVKLQVQVGLAPPGRFNGLVLGAKLLANIATLPFGYLFGPSWDFFSMSLAVGANFSYFTMSEGSVAFTDAGLVLAGMVAQLEFARFKIPGWRMASTYGLYAEYQLWFISSDVEAGTASRLSFGLRIGLL